MNFPSLFSPLQVGAYRLTHRVVMAPLTRMRAERPSLAPRPLNSEYYGQRATPGGLIIAEASPVMASGFGSPGVPGIYSEAQIKGWRSVVDAVHAKGGLIFLQLWHVGRVSHSSFQPGGVLPVAHPSWVGLPPHVPEVGELWDEADAILAVGTDFDGMMTQNWRMPQPRGLIAVNVDAGDAAKNYRPDVSVIGDARVALEALHATLPARGGLERLRGRLQALRSTVWARLEHEDPDAVELLGSLREALDANTAVFADMCIPGYWVAGFHGFRAPRRLAYPVGWGTLGFAFPASLGAALAERRPVLCVCGDGGFLFALGELATIAQEHIAVTVLLVDDGGYGMLRYDQEVSGAIAFGVDLTTPDWRELATAFGVRVEQVDGLGAPLARALGEHLARAEPSMIVVHTRLRPPPTTSPRWYRAAAARPASEQCGS